MVNERKMNKQCMLHAGYTPATCKKPDINTLSGIEHHFAEADVLVRLESSFYLPNPEKSIGTIVGYLAC